MRQLLCKRFPALILCAALLLGLCGCQSKNLFPSFPLDSESIASMEAMYGKTLEEAGKEWGFSEKEAGERLKGLWYLKKPAVIRGQKFTQALMTDLSAEGFYGLEYVCHCDSAKETADLAETLYADLVEAYGPPDPDDGPRRLRLSAEGAFDEMRSSEDTKQQIRYEQWGQVGDFSQAAIQVNTWEEEGYFCIQLTYRVRRDEQHRFGMKP